MVILKFRKIRFKNTSSRCRTDKRTHLIFWVWGAPDWSGRTGITVANFATSGLCLHMLVNPDNSTPGIRKLSSSAWEEGWGREEGNSRYSVVYVSMHTTLNSPAACMEGGRVSTGGFQKCKFFAPSSFAALRQCESSTCFRPRNTFPGVPVVCSRESPSIVFPGASSLCFRGIPNSFPFLLKGLWDSRWKVTVWSPRRATSDLMCVCKRFPGLHAVNFRLVTALDFRGENWVFVGDSRIPEGIFAGLETL